MQELMAIYTSPCNNKWSAEIDYPDRATRGNILLVKYFEEYIALLTQWKT